MDQAEALRNAVKLKKQADKPRARVITVTSGKGGVGKSNVAVNLAVQMCRQGKRVIVLDADFGLANVEVMFGTVPKYTLADLVYHGKKISEIISEGPMGIGFISAGTGITGLNNLSQEQVAYMAGSLGELDEFADVILIDTGAGISSYVLEFVLASEEVILVTTPDPSSLMDSYSLLKAIHKHPRFPEQERKILVLANRVISVNEGRQVYEKLNSVVRKFLQGRIYYVGMIPQDAALEKAVRQQQPVSIYMPYSKSAKAFESVVSELLYYGQKQEKAPRGISQLFANFWRHN